MQADHLLGELAEGGLNDASLQKMYPVWGGLFLDIVFSEGVAILQLFAHKHQVLLVRQDVLLVLDFSFDIPDGVMAQPWA